MASITKLELQQALAARNTELEAARLRIAELEGDVAALKSKLAKVPASVTKAVYVRPVREATPEQLAYRAALAQARDFAMRTGTCVKVERHA
jgi:uncharacterized protein involved in exopolysaccharide biosynthesis